MARDTSHSSLRLHLAALDTKLADRARVLWESVESLQGAQARGTGMSDGRSHCEMVESNIWTLINHHPEKQSLSPLELFLLSCAAACHDLDKGLKKSLPERMHGKVSGEFAVRLAGYSPLLRPPEAKAIDYIIRIHNQTKNYPAALQHIPRDFPIGNVNVDLRRLAVLLKAADILHTDSSRVEHVSVRHKTPRGLARIKTSARKCIYGWRIDGDRIVLNVNPANKQETQAAKQSIEWMTDNEWTPIADPLSNYGFPYILEANYRSKNTANRNKRARKKGRRQETARSYERARRQHTDKGPGTGATSADSRTRDQRRRKGEREEEAFPPYRKRRIGTLLGSVPTDAQLHTCPEPEDVKTCKLRCESLSLVAELVRAAEARTETQALVLELTSLHGIVVDVYSGTRSRGSGIVIDPTRVSEFTQALEGVFDFFKHLARPYVPNWGRDPVKRLEKFITLRRGSDPSDTHTRPCIAALKAMYTAVRAPHFVRANDQTRTKILSSHPFTDHVVGFRTHAASVIEGLRLTAASRGGETAAALVSSFSASDLRLLGHAFAEANLHLPHNKQDKLRIWQQGFCP